MGRLSVFWPPAKCAGKESIDAALSGLRAVTTFVTSDGSNITLEAVKSFRARYEAISTREGDILSTDHSTRSHAFKADELEAACR